MRARSILNFEMRAFEEMNDLFWNRNRQKRAKNGINYKQIWDDYDRGIPETK